MKKFSLIIFSLLVLIVGVGLASAADANGTVDDVSIGVCDHQCDVDEKSGSVHEVVQDDADANIIVLLKLLQMIIPIAL